VPRSKEKTTTLDELYGYLKRFALCDSLFVVGAVNATMRYGFNELETGETPEGTVRWIDDHGTEPINRIDLTIQLTRLARFLLLSRANDHKAVILDTGTPEIQQAIYLTASLHDKDVEGEVKDLRDLARIFGRISQWQFPLQGNRLHIIGRGNLLFIEVPQKIKPKYDFEEKTNEYFGMDVFQYIATGLALWITSTGILKHNMTVEVEALEGVVTKESVGRFVELSTGTPEDYRRLVRGDNWKIPNKRRDIYGLDPFVQMPAIKIKHTMKLEAGSYVVPQPHYLLQKATMGLFYLLADKERAVAEALGQGGRNDFRESFGDVYRAYVGKHLSLAQTPTVFVDLDNDLSVGGKKPDFALIEDDTCILFEVKTALLTVDSRTIFDEAAARAEIQRGAFKKALEQLCDFEEAVKNKHVEDIRFKHVRHVVKVMVGFEDIYFANAFLLPMLREIHGDTVSNLQIATITDIETAGTLLAYGDAVGALMLEKIASPELAEWSLGAFLNHKKKNKSAENPLLRKGYEDFIQKVTGKDYDFIVGRTNNTAL